jgi:hypothetical protein
MLYKSTLISLSGNKELLELTSENKKSFKSRT